jgi:hypothetical protein
LLRCLAQHRLHELVVAGQGDRLVEQRGDVRDRLQPLDDRIGIVGVDHEQRLGVLSAALPPAEDDLAEITGGPGGRGGSSRSGF